MKVNFELARLGVEAIVGFTSYVPTACWVAYDSGARGRQFVLFLVFCGARGAYTGSRKAKPKGYLTDLSFFCLDADRFTTFSHVELSKWLKARGMPPPLLPVVCGYSPLASDILKALEGGWGGGKPPPNNPDAVTAAAGGGGEPAGEAPVAAARGTSRIVAAGAAGAARREEIIDDADSPGGGERPAHLHDERTVAERPPPAPRKP